MSYQIEKGIPVPDKRCSKKKSKYPLEQMEVGDSFFAPASEISKIRGCYGRLYSGRKFVTRTVEGGIRLWRIA